MVTLFLTSFVISLALAAVIRVAYFAFGLATDDDDDCCE